MRPPPCLVRLLGWYFFYEIDWLEACTAVGDDDLSLVKDFDRLKRLWLQRTQVTDAGLPHLERLTSLRELDLRDSRVTDEGVKKLQRALPNCEIKY